MDIIELYNERQNKDDELEIILVWDKHQAMNFINSQKDKLFRISKCIDYYDERNRLRVERGKPNVTIHKKLIHSVIYNNYKLNLKEEIPIDNFNKNKINTVRFKYSVTYDLDDKWELVLSRIAELSSLTHVEIYKRYLSDAVSFDSPTLRVFEIIEVEIEYKNKGPLKLSDIDIVHNVDFTDNNFVFRYLGNLRKECTQKTTKYFSLKSILPNPIGLEKNSYKNLWKDKDNWFISIKADGINTILFIKDKKCYLLNDKETKILMIENCPFNTLIIQGELIDNKLLSYDLLYKDKNTCFNNYEDRILSLKGAIKEIKIKDIFIEEKPVKPHSYGCEKLLNECNIPNDGLILTENKPYFDSIIYKWKPLDHLTIDFLIIKPENPKKEFQEHNKVVFYLFTTISQKSYDSASVYKLEDYDKIMKDAKISFLPNKFPIQFSTPRNPLLYVFKMKKTDRRIDLLDNPCIGEFKYNAQWELVKIRDDRQQMLENGVYFGNDYYVASRIMEQYIVPLSIKDLDDFKDDTYFKQEKSNFYKAHTKVHSIIKNKIFSLINTIKTDKKCLTDIGAGKGQDIGRYKKYFDSALVIDVDTAALSELLDRVDKYEGKIELSVLNLNTMTGDNKELIPYKEWSNMVTINFAIHYMIKDLNSMNHLFNLIDDLLAKGGIFAFTCLDGPKLKNYQLALKEKDILKYSIIPVYDNEEITLCRSKVLLPFSDQLYYEEHLVDVEKIINLFIENKYTLIESKNFNELFEEIDASKELSETDKKYEEYWRYTVLQKHN